MTHRALTGARRTIESTDSEQSWKREVLYTLQCIQEVRQTCDRTELNTVRQARHAALSWTEIATALGVSRQAAWERWHELDDELGVHDGRRGLSPPPARAGTPLPPPLPRKLAKGDSA